MPTQTIIWTLLPNALLPNSQLKLAVFISPRLNPRPAPQQLSTFPDFEKWYERLPSLIFKVQVGNENGPQVAAERLSLNVDKALWTALLPADTPVHGFNFKAYKSRNIHSFQLQNVLRHVRQTYLKIAEESPTVLPKLPILGDQSPNATLSDLINTVGRLGIVTEDDRRRREQIELNLLTAMASLEDLIPGGSARALHPDIAPSVLGLLSKPELDFFLVERFYDRPESRTRYLPQPDLRQVPPRPAPPSFDFHELLASWGDYPALLRQLGLVVELAIPAANLPRVSKMRLMVAGNFSPFHQNVTPWTNYELGNGRFLPLPRPDRDPNSYDVRNSDIQHGMLKLNDASDNPGETARLFDLVQVDTDGTALKLANFAGSLKRLKFKNDLPARGIAYNTPDEAGLPALRSAGIGVARRGRAFKLVEQIQRSSKLNDDIPEIEHPALVRSGVAKPNGANGNDEAGYADHDAGETAGAADLLPVETAGAALPLAPVTGSMAGPKFENDPAGRDLTYNTPEQAGRLALRSTDLGAARRGRAFNMVGRDYQSSKLNADIPPAPNSASPAPVTPTEVLYADDLTRGYRVDVFDVKAGRWYSLCERIGDYTFLSTGQTVEIADEGYVKAASATSKERTSDLYLHESLFRWDGWSLCAPRPSRTVQPKITKVTVRGTLVEHQGEQVGQVEYDPNLQSNLRVVFRPRPGSLPRLRFGNVYRLRVRTVDLAGNSVPTTAIDPTLVSQDIRYTRFEPVEAPAVVLRAAVSEGESAEHMVIRSNFDQTATEYAVDLEVQKVLMGKWYTYRAENDRHFVPPKTSQLMAETHGMFDESFGTGKDYQKWFDIAAKESGTLYEGAHLITPPGTPNPATLPLAVPTEDDPTPDGDRLSPGQYIIHPEAQLALPYLPDVFARGVALRGLPGVSTAGVLSGGVVKVKANATEQELTLKVPFDGEWPNTKPFLLRIVERPGQMVGRDCVETFDTASAEPQWNAATRVLTVFLAKGEVAEVKYSCYLGTATHDDLADMGIWKWMQDSTRRDALRQYALAGTHWMITPFRTITLVHAVQQPLCAPYFATLNSGRGQGNTHANLTAQIRMHVKSTGKLDVQADWQEWVDNLSEPAPKQIRGQAHVAEFTIAQRVPNQFSFRHEFGDTKFRRVNYRLTGTTRFREYFPPAITQNPDQITRTGQPFRENNFLVLNSARPAAPKVRYVLPTFQWERKPTANGGVISTRRGGGLRVYLERPWYSSGDGELLGVVLLELTNLAPAERDRLKPFITQWGKDPIYASADPKVQPSVADFKLAVESRSGLSVPGLRPEWGRIAVAGYAVQYTDHTVQSEDDNDIKRQLWFADIEIDAGKSYYPFVRLALARYQPNSIPDAHLSPVVLADFAQLAPDRTLSVQVSADKTVLTVTVFGLEPSATGVSRGLKEDPVPFPPPQLAPILPGARNVQPDGLNQIEVQVEVRDPAVAASERDLGWMLARNATVTPLRFDNTQPTLTPLWYGTVKLPEPAGAKKYRLVVKEYEAFFAGPNEWQGKRIDQRLVYADVLEL